METRTSRGTGEEDAAPEQTDPYGPRYIAGFLYAGIWLVFLAVPVLAAWSSGAAWGWRALALAAVLGFAVVYLRLAWTCFHLEGDVTAGQLVVGCSALAGIALLSLPAIGPWISAYTTYMSALVIFTRAPRVGIPIGVLIWAVPSVAAYVLAAEPTLWIIGGPGMGMAFIVVFRITEYFDERDRHLAETLRQAEERDTIARDVHDVLGHSLTVLSIKAQLARRLMEADPERARHELEQIDALARESLGQVRSTVTRLKAPTLPGELQVARTALEAAEISPVIRPELPGDEALDRHGVLAWALREAVTNVVRHSGASRCEIELRPGRLRVADDGVGLGEAAEGNGLRGLRERAARSGARVLVGRAYPELEGTAPDRPGTQVEVSTS